MQAIFQKSALSIITFCVLSLLLFGNNALATSDEIQVYADEINQPMETGIEIHSNYTMDGIRTPAYEGEIPSHHVLRITPEFSLGLTKRWEVGAYLPLLLTDSYGNTYFEGMKMRLKFLSVEKGGEFFWGANCEIGQTSIHSSEKNWNTELRGILGFRQDSWLVIVNPIFGWALIDQTDLSPDFSPAIKLSYSIKSDFDAGIEHYSEIGKLNSILPINQQVQVTYGVIDIKKDKFDINCGIGHGWTDVSDNFIIKIIFGTQF